MRAITKGYLVGNGLAEVFVVIYVVMPEISPKILFKGYFTYASSQQLSSVIDTNVDRKVQTIIACDTRV